jgi:hypothetical protein
MHRKDNAYRISVVTSEGQRPHVRRWEDNIKTCLKEIRLEGVQWIKLAQDRVQ